MFPEQLPYQEIIFGTGDPIEKENVVEFRLLYQGVLLGASSTKTRAQEKHELRRTFHPQLRRLWETNRNLGYLADRWCGVWIDKHPGAPIPPSDRKKLGLRAISEKWERCGFKFIPLVTEDFTLRCRLDILFLRPNQPRYIMQGGDLDGRLKTVFDALRLPDNKAETNDATPTADEDPFFCLLQDDKLISEVSVTTDELLVLPNERQVKPNDAFLVIRVQINHAYPGKVDNYFG